MFKKPSSAAPIAAQPTTPSFDPSTWANQPRLLASNEAEAAAIEAGGWAIGAVLVVLVLAVLAVVAGAPPAPALGAVAVTVVIGALFTLWRWATTYAAALRHDTDEARRATWQREMEDGVDYDGDEIIGDPFSEIKVRRNDGGVDHVIINKPRDSDKHAPVMQGWGVSQADLVAFLYEAELAGRGLNERLWVEDKSNRYILPSGREVTQLLFRDVLAALAEHDMAEKQAGRWVLVVSADDVAAELRNLK
jgi:hypothetical protein